MQSCGTLISHSWLAGQTGHVGTTSVHITQLFCRASGTVRLTQVVSYWCSYITALGGERKLTIGKG